MRRFKIVLISLLIAMPALALSAAADIPGSATWYLHIDLKQMKSEEAGKAIYGWMVDEIFNDVKEDAGVDVERELDRLTAYSLANQGPVFMFEGDISQTTRDKVMTFIAAKGDLQPQKASGKSYYRFSGSDESGDNGAALSSGNIEIELESLQEESWVSLDLKNRILVTSSEGQMKEMLANGGKIAGSRSHDGALIVLSAEKALLQAGMNSSVLGEEGGADSGWESNILRNTQQVAFLVAAAANKLAVEAQLVTTEPDMAQSLASVVRGIISLVSFDDSMDAEAVAVLRGTRVEASGRNLNISLALDPAMVVATLNE